MLILILDDYHLGDPMFAGRLARAAAKRTVPLVLVHDSGEEGARALEALGQVVERDESGVWPVETDEEQRIIERATRDLNRKLVAEMNENGVPALRITGLDRGLLSLDREGVLRCRRRDWIHSLAKKNLVPVVAGLVKAADGTVVEVAAGQAGTAITGPDGQIGLLSQGVGGRSKNTLPGMEIDENQIVSGRLNELLAGAV